MAVKTWTKATLGAAALCGVLSMGAATANAAVFDFQQAGNTSAQPLGFSQGSISGTVTAQYSGPYAGSLTPVVTQNTYGLGVSTWYHENGEVDGAPGVETLLFEFDTKVRLNSVSFAKADDNGCVFGLCWDDDWTVKVDDVTVANDSQQNPFLFGGLSGIVASSFSVSANGWDDSWRVSQMDVSAVPLPAAAWFLLTALGGLFGTRWLKKGQTA
ncbi:VPLPA-CTERM sorting domain-containing protein [Roseospira navarrensis]|nr:VPLPA-CTERM sorting domain-containing protein [Roseospira navarrensis]